MSYAASVLTHRSLRRRHLAGLALLLVLIVWGALWGLTAYRLNAMVSDLASAGQEQAKGLKISFDDQSTDGTPWTVHVHLQNFAASFGASHDIHADEAVLYLGVLGRDSFSIKLKNNVAGHIKNLPFDVNYLKLGFATPQAPAKSHADTGFALWLKATNLLLHPESPLPVSDMVSSLDLDLRVMGTPPDFSDMQSVKAWNDASGVVEFDRFDAKWGPLVLATKGTIGLTPDLQPEGAFSGRIEGLNEALDQLVTDGLIEERQQALLKSSLDVLARPALGNADRPVVPVTLQNNALYIGPVRLFGLPRMNWDDQPATAKPEAK